MLSETRTAYLFHCRCDHLFAVSHDITGANIPRTTCTDGWLLHRTFELGVYSDVPASIMPEPIAWHPQRRLLHLARTRPAARGAQAEVGADRRNWDRPCVPSTIAAECFLFFQPISEWPCATEHRISSGVLVPSRLSLALRRQRLLPRIRLR